MAEVNLLIAGKSYRMACDDGQEPHLQGLAEQIDGKIADMRESFGEIGDMRLTVMASIVVADELAEARRRIKTLEDDIERLRNADDNALAANEAEQEEAAKAARPSFRTAGSPRGRSEVAETSRRSLWRERSRRPKLSERCCWVG